MKARICGTLLCAALANTAACDSADDSDDMEMLEPAQGDVGTYQYFYLDSYRPLVVDEDTEVTMDGQLWIYDGESGVPEHIEAFVMNPRPQSVIVTESFPIEYLASDDVEIGVAGTNAEFRLMVVALDGWTARTDSRRETFDCVQMTPDGLTLSASDARGDDELFVDWESLESHGEVHLLVLPRRTTDGEAAAGAEGQRQVSYGLTAGCSG